jgi:tellurite resistance protein/peptidoglycan hydrolase-like protein with peptidoglycan-binding domain
MILPLFVRRITLRLVPCARQLGRRFPRRISADMFTCRPLRLRIHSSHLLRPMRLQIALVMLCAFGLAEAARAQTDAVPTVKIQQRLKALGFNPGPVNGRWNARTIKALEAYQKHEGLRTDGRLSGIVLERLFPPSEPNIIGKPIPPIDFAPTGSVPTNIAATPALAPSPSAKPAMAREPDGLATPQAPISPSATPLLSKRNDVRPASAPRAGPMSALSVLLGVGIVGAGISLAGAWGWLRRAGKKSTAPVRPADRPPSTPARGTVSSSDRTVIQSQPAPATTESVSPPVAPGTKAAPQHKVGLADAVKAYDTALKSALAGHAQPVQLTPERGEPLLIDPLPDIVAIDQAATAGAPEPVKAITAAQPVKSVAAGTGWIPSGQPVTISGRVVRGGMIYVGRSLARQQGAGDENCLINPDLAVGSRPDKSGSQLGYYPAYESLTPSSRRTYLDWLASNRDDSTTNIGYVFLYLYGLERRLLLDHAAAELATLLTEVRRLLTVYGANGSFHRCATALLEAVALRDGGAPSDSEASPNGYQVPFAILLVMAQRAQTGEAVEPALLFDFIRCHPETRLRAPAKRAKFELEMLFAQEVDREFPKGVRLTDTAELPLLSRTYRAASGSFEIDLLPGLKGFRDVSGLREPTITLRRIFDACTKELDAYSRELGRAKGLRPNFEAIACLPRELRPMAIARLEGAPLAVLNTLARDHELLTPQAFTARLGLREVERVDKAVLLEWARLLGAFGYGHTADPSFALRKPQPDSRFAVFALEHAVDGATAPGQAFRAAQATLAIGVVAALADGAMEPSEQESLSRVCKETPGLTVSETNRLQAELCVLLADPITLADLTKLLKGTPVAERQQLARVAIHLVTADGHVDAQEVAFVEKLYRAIGLSTEGLYGDLHAAAGVDPEKATIFSSPASGAAFANGKQDGLRGGHGSSHGLDMARLAAIRAETAGAAELLANIFQDDALEEPEPVAPGLDENDAGGHATREIGPSDGMSIELDRRHHALLVALAERPEWPRGDFDRLVRSAGLMPGAARETLNSWALDSFDDLLLDGEEVVAINQHVLPVEFQRATA